MKFTAPYLLIASFFFISFLPQDYDLNLGFERRIHRQPRGWYAGGGGRAQDYADGYIGETDSAIVHSGKYSLHLKYISGNGFGVGTTSIAVDRVRGKKIRYSGWIKTKNLEGDAGLWWRVDGPNDKVLAFNNMHDSLIEGTRDWKRYSFELPVDITATHINFGVILEGEGEAWYDDLTIDTNGVRLLGQ